jgi:hypothetical protein
MISAMDKLSLPYNIRSQEALGGAAAVAIAYALWKLSAKPSNTGAKPLPQPPTLPLLGK